MKRSPPSPTPPALRAPPPPPPGGEGSHGDIRWKAASGGGADAGFPKDQDESVRENPFLTSSPPGSPRAVDRGGLRTFAPSHLRTFAPSHLRTFGARTPFLKERRSSVLELRLHLRCTRRLLPLGERLSTGQEFEKPEGFRCGADGECDGRNARSSTTVRWGGGSPPPLSLPRVFSVQTQHLQIAVRL